MTGNSLELLAFLQPTSIDARRGVVRMHPEVLAALGVHAWDAVELTGSHRTGAVAALALPDSDHRILYCDELVLANLGVVSQTAVTVARAVSRPAVAITVAGAPELVMGIPPEVVRLALLGKVVTIGDQVSLLPQDVAPPIGASTAMLDEARHRLMIEVGPSWTGVLLHVENGPASPSVVTMNTVVSWSDGRQTTGSVPSVFPTRRPDAFAPSHLGADLAAPSRQAVDPFVAGRRPLETPASEPTPATPPALVTPLTPFGSPVVASPVVAAAKAQEALPGLEFQEAQLKEWWDLGFHRSDLLAKLGTSAAMGVLVSGPAGSGKVTLVRSVAAALGAQVIHQWGPAVAALEPNGAAQRLRTAIAQANEAAPCVLIIEDVEVLAPRAEAGPLTSLLVEEIVALVREGRVAVACTTTRPEAVSAELRRPGALDHQLVVPLPDRAGRRALLDVLCRPLPLGPDVRLDEIAARTPGFVAADIHALGREAANRAAHRFASSTETPMVGQVDFAGALEVVRPTSMGENSVEVGRVTLDDVGDMVEVKAALTEAVLWPLSYPDTFRRMGISPPRGVLLYGPPGCGKTYLVKAVAAAGEANILSVKGAELLSKYVGDSEAGVRELFRRAREAAPTLIFLDEVDALAPVRGQSTDSGVTDRVVAALLTELDGVEDLRDVVVVGATNRPDMVDPALLRPGRLERLVYVPPPDADARAAILKAAAAKVPLDPEVDLSALAAGLEQWSSADLAALIRESAMTAMRRSMEAPSVTAHDVATARTVVKPSLRTDQVASLAAYASARAASA